MNAPNPYRFVGGPPPTGEHFVERPELTRRITQVWRRPGRPGNLSVIGSYRAGKTSLVHHALRGVDRDDLGVVQISMGAQPSMSHLFHTLVREVIGVFPHVPALGELYRPMRETRDWFELHSHVTAFFTELARRDLHVLIVLDEFDHAPLVAADLSGFRLLRTLAGEAAYKVGLMTVSRRRVMQIETTATGDSRLDQVMTDRLYVGAFTAAEAGELVDRAREAEVDLSAVVPDLYALSGLHPYLLGRLCHRVMAHYQQTGVLDVAAAVGKEAAAFHSHFTLVTDSIDEEDTPPRGADLLRELASGARVHGNSQELDRLVELGIVTRNGTDLRLLSREFADFARDPDGYRSGDRERTTPYRCTALVVATEWGSAHGGLSTFNQRLCVALAAEGVRVFCMVLEATGDEREEAAGQGVTLLHRPQVVGEGAHSRLSRLPEELRGVTLDMVIGHGRITGYPASVLAEDYFGDPKPKRLHFVHMDPDEIEWHKPDGDNDAVETAEHRKRIEVQLGRTAHRMVAVGPRLHDTYTSAMPRRTDRDPLRFDPGFDMADPSPRKIPGGSPVSVLVMGRMEDAHLKGVDLAARACGIVAGWRKEKNLRRIELVVRGLPKDDATAQVARLREWAGSPLLSILPRHYTTDAETLADDMERASLLLMPSRGEGFGLAGLEAIVAGTPALISDVSGLGELLRKRLTPERAAQVLVPVTNDFDHDVKEWARAIDRMLLGIEAEFPAAQRMREGLAATHTWAASADALLTALGF
ncbi:glycosyltransferase [Streptomyces sp. NPDC051976]|uniref:glycosyltransferase n=1 Tax=Streptomyces sp. NPDC051976 TaxID=3154947 RepID=UPI00342A204B